MFIRCGITFYDFDEVNRMISKANPFSTANPSSCHQKENGGEIWFSPALGVELSMYVGVHAARQKVKGLTVQSNKPVDEIDDAKKKDFCQLAPYLPSYLHALYFSLTKGMKATRAIRAKGIKTSRTISTKEIKSTRNIRTKGMKATSTIKTTGIQTIRTIRTKGIKATRTIRTKRIKATRATRAEGI
ncbi:kinase-interacting protein 1 [Plakobranchus ocellatus]|uniref:Kinase-interacting protein 1 n=1 Tax=Plakobranchus ocellatus TaxID=259542 RepID=A0AAV4CNE0_9GAST|nr:kinase-interacting protein 1 [Plakobranchus ocellatus]